MSLPRLPAPDEAVLLVHGDAGQIGPISRRALRAQLDDGAVKPDDHIWMQGMEGWIALSTVPELIDGLDAAPSTPPAEGPPVPGETEDDRLDRIFGELVEASWEYLEDHEFASHIDEVFLGALITGGLDNGLALIDLHSDGTHHYLRFQDMKDHSRVIVRMTHLTPSLSVSKVLGQRASIVIGYGEKVAAIGKVMSAVQAEYKSGFLSSADPGTITVDGDLASGYVYCQVDMFWNIDHYVRRDYAIDTERLATHIGATTHALRKYLRGRFT